MSQGWKAVLLGASLPKLRHWLLGYSGQRIPPLAMDCNRRALKSAVMSVGLVALTGLDYLAYAIITEPRQPLLAEYANGERSLQSLIAALQGQ